jgi:hypothetical protein
MKGLGVLALRFQRTDQEYKTPFNFRIGKTEIPVGLAVTVIALFLVAVANLFTKKVATVYGISFTVLLYVVFHISERLNKRQDHGKKGLEEFNLDHQEQVGAATLHARPGSILVAIRDFHNMDHLKRVLEKTDLHRHDIVVMTVRPLVAGDAEYELRDQQIFSDYEKELFTRVVTLAEKEGKPVELLVVPATDPFVALVQTAQNLKASKLVTGISRTMAGEELARRIGLAWESLPEPKLAFSLEIFSPDRQPTYVNLGPHPPRLWPEDVERVHDLWLRLTGEEHVGSTLHHRDVVGVALRRLERELETERREQIVEDIKRESRRN